MKTRPRIYNEKPDPRTKGTAALAAKAGVALIEWVSGLSRAKRAEWEATATEAERKIVADAFGRGGQ